jgi:4-diphosphocytidyl-2-C-methyl-D-erythritol kinase
MSEPSPTRIVIEAPAKLNLGLEVLGRRSDGFHELATIFLTIGLFDRLAITESPELRLICDRAELGGEENLILRALRALQDAASIGAGATVALAKRIPIAAGLGGASSDAAAALLGAGDLWRLNALDEMLQAVGRTVGSDVPFFLRGGCALGRGIGEELTPLPLPTDASFVVVAPAISIPRKTATLYAALTPFDFSDGSRVMAQSARLQAGLDLDPALLGNAFSRALHCAVPAVDAIPRIMPEAGAPWVALSGAGPAHYTMVPDPELAQHITMNVRQRLGNKALVFVVAPIPARSGWQASIM